MYKLYYSPGSCAMAPHVVLRELGLPYELKKISIQDGENRSPEFLKVNPRGSVPVLELPQGQVVREGAAILLTLAEAKENELMPKQNVARAVALEWLMFANSTLHPTYSALFFWKKKLGETAKDNDVVHGLTQKLQMLWDEVESRLEGRSYLCGETLTLADILVSVIAGWNPAIPLSPKLGAKTTAMIQRVTARPAFQEAMQEEGVEHAMAAKAA